MSNEKLIELASIHEATDYADPKAVEVGNNAADALRTLIKEYCEAGRFDELLELLSHKSLGGWVAFVLVEWPQVSLSHKNLCIEKIRKIAKSTSNDSIGAQFWLRDHGYENS